MQPIADVAGVAFITEAAPVEQILSHIGEPLQPPPISSARGPPGWDDALEPMPDRDFIEQPEPELEFEFQHVPSVGLSPELVISP